MFLKRSEIERAIHGDGEYSNDPLVVRPLVSEFRSSDAGNASLDVRLGRWFLTLKHANAELLDIAGTPHLADLDLAQAYFTRFDDKFILHPGRFVLGVTLEWVRMPNRCCGSIVGKTSLGRHGLSIETAPVVHPGFSGCLTLELSNVGEIPIALRPGMEIAQLQIALAEGSGEGIGRFKGYRRPTLGRRDVDPVLERLRGNAEEKPQTKNG